VVRVVVPVNRLPWRADRPYRVKVPTSGVERIPVSPTPDETYDAALAAVLTAVACAAAAVLSAYAVAHLLLLEGTPRLVLLPVAAASAGACAAVAVVHHVRRLPTHLAHPLTAGIVLVLLGNAAGHMVLAAEPQQSTHVMLALVAAGALLLSLRWLLVVLYLGWGAWTVGAFVVGPAPRWSHYVAGMIGATLLAVAINHLRRSGVQALAVARASADAAAVRDQLTGVANRRGLAMVGGQMVEQARRQGDAVHCIFVDIDDLKRVNDTLGHAVGDDVIVSVAEALRSVTRATDIVARWGGDEFCVVGPGPGMAPLELERRVRDTVAEHDPVPAEIGPVRVSAGGAMLAPWDAGTLETLLGKADQEMYLRRSLRKEGAAPSPRAATAE
jgi:diguanylate cyclase (GGDEF)-like protein